MPGLIYNIHQHSGMIFQCVYEIQKKRNQKGKEILAAGGRYDAMIQYYRNLMEQINMAGKDVQQSAVGKWSLIQVRRKFHQEIHKAAYLWFLFFRHLDIVGYFGACDFETGR